MTRAKMIRRRRSWVAFGIVFAVCVSIGLALSLDRAAAAAPLNTRAAQTGSSYAGAEACKQCHEEIYNNWTTTRHAQAFSLPVFQRDWTEKGSQAACLACHTTGYDQKTGNYVQPGVTCESCHGAFQSGHPETPMPITPDANLCSQCHKTTTDEWRASQHSANSVQCQRCHNPHSQKPMAESVTALCSNCHKERSDFAHSTHSNAGLECSNCHMYTAPHTEDNILGLLPTGHMFTVGSDACIGCHQDTVHSRNEILKLSGEVSQTVQVDPEALQQQLQSQEQTISNLESKSTVRLYTGLAQGAIIGLITGGVAAWVVSRRIQVVEVVEDEYKKD